MDRDIPPPEDDFELPVAGFQGTPEEIERQWFEQVYTGRGDSMPQLTWRAVLMGSVLGGVLSLTNLYIGLKAGWGFGVAITACILSYAIWTAFYKIGLVRTPMTILENNCMQSTASSAGYSTGGTLVSAFAAYIMLNQPAVADPADAGWVFFLAVLGVTMAIPMKRQMINIEQLRFPSGIAAAETLRRCTPTATKALRAAQALGIAAVAGRRQPVLERAASRLIGEILQRLSASWHAVASRLTECSIGSILDRANRRSSARPGCDRTVLFAWDPIFLAAGALTGLRVSASMLLGGTLCWAVFVPILQHQGSSAAPRSTRTSSSGPSGAASPAWSRPACSRSPCNGGAWSGRSAAWPGCSRAARPGHVPRSTPSKRPCSWFVAGQLVSLVALAMLATSHVRHALLAERAGRAALVLPGSGGLPRDRRDRHDAHRRHGQSDAT